jgi:hypothetical protein
MATPQVTRHESTAITLLLLAVASLWSMAATPVARASNPLQH